MIFGWYGVKDLFNFELMVDSG